MSRTDKDMGFKLRRLRADETGESRHGGEYCHHDDEGVECLLECYPSVENGMSRQTKTDVIPRRGVKVRQRGAFVRARNEYNSSGQLDSTLKELESDLVVGEERWSW